MNSKDYNKLHTPAIKLRALCDVLIDNITDIRIRESYLLTLETRKDRMSSDLYESEKSSNEMNIEITKKVIETQLQEIRNIKL